MKLIAEILVDQVDQRFNLLRLECIRMSTLQYLANIAGLQKREIVPPLQVGIDPRRYSGQQLIQRARQRVRSQRRRHQLPHNPRIECISRQPKPAVAEQVFRRASARTNPGANMQQREVAGAAAKVADQDQLVMVQCGLIGVCRRDRLHLEVHGLEPGMKKCLPQSPCCKGIVIGVVCAHKPHGPAYSGMTNRLAKLPLRVLSKVCEDARDQVFDAVPPAEDLSSGEAAARKIGFQRLDQPPLILSREIVLDSSRPGKALHLAAACLLMLFEVQNGAKRFRDSRSCRERDELHWPPGEARAIELFVVPKSMPIERLVEMEGEAWLRRLILNCCQAALFMSLLIRQGLNEMPRGV